MKESLIRIYSLKLANELINKGYKLVKTEVNIKYPQYKVFLFEYTDELHKILENIKNKRTKYNNLVLFYY